MRFVGLILSLILASFAWAGPDHTAEPVDDIKASVLAGKSLLVDVREQDEWNAGHLAAAALVPLSALQANGEAAAKPLPRGKPIYLHCRSGKRSVVAAKILKDLGYDGRALAQGYDALLAAGFLKAP